MKITHLYSATELIESNGVKILIDPWLVDGEYYGSWCCYPSMKDFNFSTLDDVDYIYISHIHPDHLSPLTLKRLNKDIPVLIRNYKGGKFVKLNLERLGFKVIELDDGVKTHLKNDVYINIYGAGYCNPEICSKMFGCGINGFDVKMNYGISEIDTMCVIDDGKYNILNVNDTPYNISKFALDKVLKDYKKIDILLHGYTGASEFPHCFENYSTNDIKNSIGKKQKDYYIQFGLDYIEHIKPKYNIPFAGTYVLGGELSKTIEPIRIFNEIEDAAEYYELNKTCDSETILMNTSTSFDLVTEKLSEEYVPTDKSYRAKYIKECLSDLKYDFDDDVLPTLNELKILCQKAFYRFDDKREELNYETDTCVYIHLMDEMIFRMSCNGNGYTFIHKNELKDEPFVSFKVNSKLLSRLLKGPRFAHWNNAEIGCHILFNRKPDVYDRGIHFCMNYFHL